jgi:acyl carrier protein
MCDPQEWLADVLMCAPESLPAEHTPLNQIEGWDSLKHVSLILSLERTLNQKLSADQIRSIVTIRDLASVLERSAADA